MFSVMKRVDDALIYMANGDCISECFGQIESFDFATYENIILIWQNPLDCYDVRRAETSIRSLYVYYLECCLEGLPIDFFENKHKYNLAI